MVDNVKADGVFVETPNRFGIVESSVEYREETSKWARLLARGEGDIRCVELQVMLRWTMFITCSSDDMRLQTDVMKDLIYELLRLSWWTIAC